MAMLTESIYQPLLLAGDIAMAKFPGTRYQGSKAKLADWIWEQIKDLDFDTCLDAFGGTGAVGYRLKQESKRITYNDILRFNYYIGVALIKNSAVQLTTDDVDWILTRHSNIDYPNFIEETFRDIYFTDAENAWLDQTMTNINHFADPYKFALAFFALAQAAIIKRPYNLFHRKNLYVRLADVERSFGNKTSWDRPFAAWFGDFVAEANQAVFDNGRMNQALNNNALEVPGAYDLVYIDTPYISRQGEGVDYRDFYHFLEGLTMYEAWETQIDHRSKHRRLKRSPDVWTDKQHIYAAFDRLFRYYQDSILVVSYRSDGIPSAEEILVLLRKYKRDVRAEWFGQYKYVLSTNHRSEEVLFIAQ